MLVNVKKVAVVGSPMPSMCTLCLSKKLGGIDEGIAETPDTSIFVSRSGRACLIVAIRLNSF